MQTNTSPHPLAAAAVREIVSALLLSYPLCRNSYTELAERMKTYYIRMFNQVLSMTAMDCPGPYFMELQFRTAHTVHVILNSRTLESAGRHRSADDNAMWIELDRRSGLHIASYDDEEKQIEFVHTRVKELLEQLSLHDCNTHIATEYRLLDLDKTFACMTFNKDLIISGQRYQCSTTCKSGPYLTKSPSDLINMGDDEIFNIEMQAFRFRIIASMLAANGMFDSCPGVMRYHMSTLPLYKEYDDSIHLYLP